MRVVAAAVAVWGGAAAVLALPPSSSKIGIHLIQNNTSGVTQICNARPRVIKILDVYEPMLAAVRNYKQAAPDGIVVLRVYTTRHYNLSDNPGTSAVDFFNHVLLPAINSLSPADRALIDYLEGPNEGNSTPSWGTLEDAQWFNDFWVALAPLIGDAGFKPCAFSIAVGNPPGTLTEMQQKLAAVVPALRVCRQYDGAWSYHAYTPDWSTDVSFQIWYSLRYRQFYSYFAQHYPDLADLPLILTEAGFDSGGSPTDSGWQANGTAEQYQEWLMWWDGQINQDAYVLGSTLFQIGSPATWPSFDLEPIAAWMAAYLSGSSSPVLVCSPTSFSPVVFRGDDAAPDTFTVTNAGEHEMSYTISEIASWLSVNPAGGTSSGQTDTITVSYTTSNLAAGTYTSQIDVLAPGAENSPTIIPVSLTVVEPPIPGDLNEDRHVDYRDVAIFLSCMTGSDNGPLAPECELADVDSDTDVDQSDFGILQRCITGDGAYGDPDCANP